MKLRKRILWLISIMITVTLGVEIFTMGIFYKTAFREEMLRLSELAKSQSRLIESIFRFNKNNNMLYPDGPKAATLSQLIDSHNRYRRFSETGELLLAEKQGNKIHFFFGHRQDEIIKPEPVPTYSGLAEPMLLALSGKSGTVVGCDYTNKNVLAAYDHVAEMDIGIVAKVDISEIRAPFIRSFYIVLLVGLIAVIMGVILFSKITNPMINEMSCTIENLEDVLKDVKLLSGIIPICATCKKIRDDKGYWSQVELYIKNHSEAEFSHGICPDCSKKIYLEIDL